MALGNGIGVAAEELGCMVSILEAMNDKSLPVICFSTDLIEASFSCLSICVMRGEEVGKTWD